jgi:methylenetetrahydrofolate dehydrogenase (NADP+)/methenyltetrahydrofolate cyclohydrolase
MELINCRQIANDIKETIAQEVYDLCVKSSTGHDLYRRPNLAVILVGSRPDSELYVRIKSREAETVGMDFSLYRLADNVNETEILNTINFLNKDEAIDGILIQLPLPEHLDTDKIITAINPAKDVDGFHPDNLAQLIQTESSNKMIPPTFGAVKSVLDYCKLDLTDKKIIIIGKDSVFTNNLNTWLSQFGAEVATYLVDDNWSQVTLETDVIISAVGQANLIGASMTNNEAVIIDIGINVLDGKTVGDVDIASFEGTDCRITPVPGGIGPLTVALALQNNLRAFVKSRNS